MTQILSAPVIAEKGEIEFWKGKKKAAKFTIPTTFFRWKPEVKPLFLDPDQVAIMKKKEVLNMLSDIASRCAETIEPLWVAGEALPWFEKKGIKIDELTELERFALKMMYAQQALTKQDLHGIQKFVETIGGLTHLEAPIDSLSGSWKGQYFPPGWLIYDINYMNLLPREATDDYHFLANPVNCPLWLTLHELLKFAEAFKMVKVISSAVRKQRVTQDDWNLLGPNLQLYGAEDRIPPQFARFQPHSHHEMVHGAIGIAFQRLAQLVNVELSRINLSVPSYEFFGFSPHYESEVNAAIGEIQTSGSFFPKIVMNFPDTKSVLWHWFTITTLGKSDISICADCERFFTRRPTGRPAKFCSRKCENRARQRKYQRHRRANGKGHA